MSKKPISLWQATAIGLGNIIGAGIFVLAGTVINQAGPGAVLSFLLTAILAITVALNSAELASKIVSHGGIFCFKYCFRPICSLIAKGKIKSFVKKIAQRLLVLSEGQNRV